MAKGHGKGSDFERSICKRLSLWWTGGERDDVYWRSSQSGGRATQRMKSGRKTFGSYGDIAFVDPIGEPLLKLFTIELKRGQSHGNPGDLFETAPSAAIRPWEATVAQSVKSHRDSGSQSWMVIGKRDHRLEMVYMGWEGLQYLTETANLLHAPCARFAMILNGKPDLHVRFVSMPLQTFLDRVKPQQIIDCVKRLS